MFSSPQVDHDQLPSLMFLLYVTRISVVAGSTLSAPACGTLLMTTGGALVIEGLSIGSSAGSALGASAAGAGAGAASAEGFSAARASVIAMMPLVPPPTTITPITAAATSFDFVHAIMV